MAGPATTNDPRISAASVAGIVRVPQFGNLRLKPYPLPLSTCNALGLGSPKVSSQMFSMDHSRVLLDVGEIF